MDKFVVWCFSQAGMIMSVDEESASRLAEMYPATIYFFAELGV